MANFNVLGLDDLIRQMDKRSKRASEKVPHMLKAGAEVLVTAEKQEAKVMGIEDTGDFIKSIKPTKIKKDKEGNRYIEVYPQGKDRKGESNAEKGFIAEYGTSKLPRRPWMSAAKAKSEDAIKDAYIKIWEADESD